MHGEKWRGIPGSVVGMLLAGALLLLAGCGGAAHPAASAPAAPAKATTSPGPAAKLTKVTYETSFFPISPVYLPVYLALHRGFYKRDGLDVKIVIGHSAVLVAQQVGAGSYDIGDSIAPSVILGRAKGVPIKSFMVEINKSAFGILTAKSSGVKSWKGLYGKQVLTIAGGPQNPIMQAVFAKLGLQTSKVRLVNVAPQNLVTDFIRGKGVGLATGIASFFPLVNAKRPVNVLPFDQVVNVLDDVYISSTSYMSKHPNVIRAFSKATGKALSLLHSSPSAVREAVNDMIHDNPGYHLNAAALAGGWKLYSERIVATPNHPLGWSSQSAWAQTIAVMSKFGGLKSSAPPSHYYTNRYLQ